MIRAAFAFILRKPRARLNGRNILDFERMLADDGTSILKFFFHIGKKEQRRRFKAIEADPLGTAIRVRRDRDGRAKGNHRENQSRSFIES